MIGRGLVRCRALAVVLGVLGATALSAQAATPTDSVSVFLAQRQVASAATVTVTVNFAYTPSGGYVGYIGLYGVGAHAQPRDGLGVDLLAVETPSVEAGGARYGCGVGSACSLSTVTNSPGGLAQFIVSSPRGTQQPSAIYVVVRGHDKRAVLTDTSGWTLREVPLRTHFALAQQPAAAQVAELRVEHFQNATVRTSSRRSLALGSPPCRPLHNLGFVREGTGSVTLAGGGTNAPFDCRQNGTGDPVSMASRPTTWTLMGDVTGSAHGPTRLVVIDL